METIFKTMGGYYSGMPATLASIAADLGISRTTVSNAYNHPDQLSPALRRRILSYAEARGYTGPNPHARSLRTQRTAALGVVLTEHLSFAFEDRASVDFLAGVADSSEYALTLIPTGVSVRNAIVDGVIVYSVPEGAHMLLDAQSRNLPLIICDQPTGVAGVPYVGIDDAKAIAPAAEALVAAGHRRIGILAKRLFSTPTNGFVAPTDIDAADLHVQRARIRGALDVFTAAGITAVPVVTRDQNDLAAATDGARELLETHPELTAVLCTTDSMALGVIEYCRGRRAIPEELSVTGFDGIGVPGLTTVVQPNRRKGEVAAMLVRSLIEGRPQRRERTLLPTTFLQGTSVAPAPAG